MPGSGNAGEPPLWYVLERKSAHVFEFAVLTGLTFVFLREVFARERWRRVLWAAGAWSIAYGALDELHQAFVFGRGSRLSDVMVDAFGAGIAALTLFFILRRRKRGKKLKKVIY
ncbi:MAG: VanZ family protein [Candidatus Moranbacteria bacterium]|nr:VanZ family protein [Candidatus Moranbacteria bacterium]MBP6034426.1 VanZ family protein [Candidatus Moranbacteria bacterium]MBP7695709.1 VanZ family protein [Candidatus Moranbacteria bacterium]